MNIMPMHALHALKAALCYNPVLRQFFAHTRIPASYHFNFSSGSTLVGSGRLAAATLYTWLPTLTDA